MSKVAEHSTNLSLRELLSAAIREGALVELFAQDLVTFFSKMESVGKAASVLGT